MELLSLVSTIGFAFAWHSWQRTTAASAALHAVAGMLLALYVGSLLALLFPTAVLLLVVGLFLFGLAVFRQYRNGELPPVAIGLFGVLCLIYWTIHSSSSLLYYDEYSHWGVYLKEMLAKDALWGADTNSLHPRYLPGTSLWQYFFAMFSTHHEGAAYLAQFVLLLTPLLVLWEKTTWKQTPWHFGVLVLVIISLFNFGHGFTSLYVDHILAVWFAGILLNVLAEISSRSFRQLLTYLLPLCVLILTKTTGAFFAVAAAGIVSLLFLVIPSRVVEPPSVLARWGKAIGFASAAMVLGLAVVFVWTVNRDALEITESDIASSSALVGGLAEGQSILDEVQQAELKRRFVQILLHQQISKNEVSSQYNAFSYPTMGAYTDSFRLTTVSLLGFSLIAIFFLWHTTVSKEKRGFWVLTAGCVWLSAVVYIAALYFGTLYLTTSEYALLWSSYIRYAHSMILPVVLFCFAALLPIFAESRLPTVKISENYSVRRNSVIFVLAISAMLIFEPPYLASLYKAQSPHQFRAQIEPVTDRLREITGDATIWVFFPNDVANGSLGQMLQYQLSPGRVHVEESPERLNSDVPRLRDDLSQWEYIWFADKSTVYREASEQLIGQDLANGLFQIEVIENEVRFSPLNDIF